MTKLIGFTFFLACPFVFGIFIPLTVAMQFHLDIVACSSVYIAAWTWLHVNWYDGSKYQDFL